MPVSAGARALKVRQVIHFQSERFFEGAVQLSWMQRRPEQARQAAEAFVFHGPRYHGVGKADQEGIESAYKLKDTASFVRDLLGSMIAGTDGREVNPYWLAVAGYGSGKSHLALTCAMLLSEPTGETAQAILQQIERADAEIGKIVAQQVATLGKPALVLALDGMSGFHLGNALSRAVFEQLRRHGVDAGAIRGLSPRFQTAEQFVERNFAIREESFGVGLPGIGAKEICERLRENDEGVYAAVDALYSEANGHPIPIEGQESAQELIDTLCSVYCGPGAPFSHVIVLFDELGRYLEYASEKPQLAGDSALQQIFQGVQDNSTKVRFVGFIQYELKAYLKRFNATDLRQLQRYVTRFDAAEKWYLSTNLETIFAHMIGKNEKALAQVWSDSRAKEQIKLTRQRLSRCLPGFSRFPVWSDADSFDRIVAQGCWPLHPFAVWFLTRHRDLVQSRSALTFIKDVIDRIADEPSEVEGRLRQVSAAELVVGSMLPELLSAEREAGGTIVDTLNILLEKFAGHLDTRQQLVLAGVAVIEKSRIGKQARERVDELLCEATAMDPGALPECLRALADLGAMEWNDDLGQYELLSDGATRGQFQHWLRAQQATLTADAIRDLYVRRGKSDLSLGDITPDFAQNREISTPDWVFEGQLAHANIVENTIKRAFQEWLEATLPKDAKGKLLYVYIHPDDNAALIGERIHEIFQKELKKAKQPRAPIWVIGIDDQNSLLAEHLGRVYLFDEQMSAADQGRFRRFLADERDRSLFALKEAAETAIKKRLYWVAGFAEVPAGRIRAVGLEIFAAVYPKAVPFPFDGFATAAGGGPADAAQLARGLVARQVDGAWIQSQPKRLQNRIDAILVKSWKAISQSGKLVDPAGEGLKPVFEQLVKSHQNDPQRSLLESYRALILPPYGLNASSAALLLGLLLGLDSPPRRLERAGELVAFAGWLGDAFSGQRGKHNFDEAVLAESRLRFLSEDSADRWRSLLNRWTAETHYSGILECAREAERMGRVDPVPEALEGNLKYLEDQAGQTAARLQERKAKISDWERGLEKAERQSSVEHAIRIGSNLQKTRNEMHSSNLWPETYVEQCDRLLALAKGQIVRGVEGWIPRQNCRSSPQVGEFRQEKEFQVRGLDSLGFHKEASALDAQAKKSIFRVEKQQKFGLTLGQCDDYPRQPEPTDSTPVQALRDEISRGDGLIEALKEAKDVLDKSEIAAHVDAIRKRQERLRSALKRQRSTLTSLYGLALETQEKLEDALTRVARLRDVFLGTSDESDVADMFVQLERVRSDLDSWETGDVSVDRLEELLAHQVEHQVAATQAFLEAEGLEPAWDIAKIYQDLMRGRLEMARKRSADWVQPRLVLASQAASLERQRGVALARELAAAPAYLSLEHAARIDDVLKAVQKRLEELNESERRSKVLAWQQRYLDLGDLGALDRHTTEQLLRGIGETPCEPTPEEQAQLFPIAERLTRHLDQMSMEELFTRIARLSKSDQRQLHERLALLMA